MAIATLPRKRKKKPQTSVFGIESNGVLMTPEEFDHAEFDELWDYELINGVLIVSPIPLRQEADPNEELGYMLRLYHDSHPKGKSLDFTLGEQYVKTGANRRRADRVIWSGLGRLPGKDENPTIIVEFVSERKRDRDRDYEAKRDEYQALKVQEYWIIDRFERAMTAHVLMGGKYRKKVVSATQTYRTKLLPGFQLPLARLLELADRWADEEDES